jgi:adenine-specific DNA methylase
VQKFLNPKFEDIVSELAQFESGKRQYYRPIYSIHKWWARRPGALFRAILLSAIEPDKDLFSDNGELTKNSYYFSDHTEKEIIILDPFMGGGTTLVEANRIGLKVIGCDLNPVSYWIVRESLKHLDTKRLEKYFFDLSNSVGKKIKALYSTTCTRCSQKADTLYAFWLRFISCPNCGSDIYLFKRSLLNRGLIRTKPPSEQNPATAFCTNCFALNDWDGKSSCACLSCKTVFNPEHGTYDEGKCSCANCGQEHIALVDIMRSGQKLKEKLVAIEYICKTCQSRLYKVPDTCDLEKLEKIQSELDRNRDNLIIPKQKILPGDSSVRWRTHNYEHYFEVFNSRQLLAFNYLIEGIKSIRDESYQHAFITAFSNSLEYNNMMTPYNYPHRKLHHLFNYHAMPLTTTPVENSVWGAGAEGAGTFVNCFNRYLSAKKYCQNPFDKFKDKNSKIQTLYSKEVISSQLVETFSDLLTTSRGALLLCGDSACLSQLPDKSVNFVITDPPYYDSIHYSELSNFFYVWLKNIVSHNYFSAEHVPVDGEAIVNETMDKGEKEYQRLLTAVFKECNRILADNGKLIFTFHHTKWKAWWTVLMAIINSGFRVTDSFPVMSEYKVNPHIRNKQSLDMDLVLICQKNIIQYDILNLLPHEIMARAFESLGNRSNGVNENRLFLHFMGELLRTACATAEPVNYKRFENVLLHFDSFKVEIARSSNEDKNDQSNKYFQQLKLFEIPDGYSLECSKSSVTADALTDDELGH